MSSRPPSGTLPSQLASPEPPSSEQLKSTSTSAPRSTSRPSTGLAIVTTGLMVSGATPHASVPASVTV